jgi:hypothetical protein
MENRIFLSCFLILIILHRSIVSMLFLFNALMTYEFHGFSFMILR